MFFLKRSAKKSSGRADVTDLESPRRRLSLFRVLIALVLVSGSAYWVWNRLPKFHETIQSESPYSVAVRSATPWFAAYVDVTSTPSYAFEQMGSTKTPDAVLSFIVASPSDPCVPTWGTHYTLNDASVSLDLDRRIARLQQRGGRVAVSFGGALNSELSLACKDPAKLVNAYRSVIEHYNIDTIDLDLENQSLNDSDAAARRFAAISQIQKSYRDQGRHLAVWLTLPVAPQGLTKEGTDAVAAALSGGVDIAGVNLMVMDYGASRDQGQTMLDASERALIETHRQLGVLYQKAGINLNSDSLWRKIGATPMIGQNDMADEVFSVEDAQHFNEFAVSKKIGRMSMWSANRDIPCGENYVDLKVVSDSCSGVSDPKYSFSQALSKGFDGDLAQNALMVTVEDPKSNVSVVDDPSKSPYQIWKETGSYPKGVKVVWHGNVYQAKWWTKNDLPDNPVLQSWETPWYLVGPVLSGDRPIPQATLPSGAYPKWSGTVVYNGGDRVLFENVPFQAKWWNEGESPAASAANPDSSPWVPLTQSQISDILKAPNASKN